MEVYRYELRSKQGAALNAVSTRTSFRGALIRSDDGGVGCIHPWEEMGDAPVEEQLDSLKKSKEHWLPLAACAVQCAEIDWMARSVGRSLFEGLDVPRSHYLWNGFESREEQLSCLEERRYPAVKLKLGPKWRESMWIFDEVPGKKRLDFNSSLSSEEFVEFLRALGQQGREQVEWIEDPCPYQPDVWASVQNEFGVWLALDQDFIPGSGYTGADLAVLKPAKDRCEALMSSEKVMVTSYMDHPVGQLWATYVAASLAKNCPDQFLAAGLLTHPLLEGEEAFAQMDVDSEGRLIVPEGTGIGLDTYLNNLNWEKLP